MKKNNLIYGILFMSTLSLSSCIKSSDLNVYSQTSFSDVDVFVSTERIENQVRGFYSAIRAGNLLGSRALIYNDAKAENFLSNDPNRVTARAAWEFTETDTDNEVNNLWNAAYSAINRVNLFLDGMTEEGDAVAGADAARFRGEARFIRAVAYYYLLQFYALPYGDGNGSKPGVPLRLVGLRTGGSNDLPRSTVGEVYNQIIEDLTFAENNLPLSYSTPELNTTRAHRNTAIAFKVRAYLSMQQYPNVVTEANKIVSTSAPFTSSTGVAYSLEPNIEDVFTTNTNRESIWKLPFTNNETPGTQNQLGFYYMPNGVGGAAGIFYINPAGIWGNSAWTADDARRDLTVTSGDGKVWLAKYTKPGPFLDWSPIIRYSEVLLSLAEGITRSNATVQQRAVDLLNAVRGRSDADATYDIGDFASPDELVDAILTERNIEFLGEGIRSLDIIRLVQPYPAKAVPGGVSVGAVAPTNQAYVWPIPSEEVRYNKGL